jgi:hypothetical protein
MEDRALVDGKLGPGRIGRLPLHQIHATAQAINTTKSHVSTGVVLPAFNDPVARILMLFSGADFLRSRFLRQCHCWLPPRLSVRRGLGFNAWAGLRRCEGRRDPATGSDLLAKDRSRLRVCGDLAGPLRFPSALQFPGVPPLVQRNFFASPGFEGQDDGGRDGLAFEIVFCGSGL